MRDERGKNKRHGENDSIKMEREALRKLLEEVSRGKKGVEEAMESLRDWPGEDLGYAVIDHQRTLRKGFPEVIFCGGKERDDILEIFQRLARSADKILATRVPPDVAGELAARFDKAHYNPRAGTVSLVRKQQKKPKGKIVVIAAGTSDIPVAEEAKETAAVMGSRVETLYDVGVAGLHRLLGRVEIIRGARVLVVVAGMDGALSSVVGGLYQMPLIAVPTSVGYGAAFSGVAPLLAMLNSCAPGVAVVNIDNGFGAGYMAHMINMVGED